MLRHPSHLVQLSGGSAISWISHVFLYLHYLHRLTSSSEIWGTQQTNTVEPSFCVKVESRVASWYTDQSPIKNTIENKLLYEGHSSWYN